MSYITDDGTEIDDYDLEILEENGYEPEYYDELMTVIVPWTNNPTLEDRIRMKEFLRALEEGDFEVGDETWVGDFYFRVIKKR